MGIELFVVSFMRAQRSKTYVCSRVDSTLLNQGSCHGGLLLLESRMVFVKHEDDRNRIPARANQPCDESHHVVGLHVVFYLEVGLTIVEYRFDEKSGEEENKLLLDRADLASEAFVV